MNKIDNFDVSEGLRCFYFAYAQRFGKVRFGDKTPEYCSHIAAISRALPESYFIHIIRDGRDVLLSNQENWNIGSVQGFAEFWMQLILAARHQAAECPHYMEVRYEDLLQNTTKVLQTICAFLSLNYEKEMERYYCTAGARLGEVGDFVTAHGRTVKKDERLRFHRLTRQPPNPFRIGRWRWGLNRSISREFEQHAGRLLCELGYD